jgi:predicted SprT family Zn-dependent metalloprotease
MVEFGVADYVFVFKPGRKWLGMCRFPIEGQGEIQLNLEYVEARPREIVEDTIRHEIAHALAYCNCRHTGHGKPWKEACVLTGARPERLAHRSQTVLGPWQARCKGCGEPASRYRPPKSDRLYYHKRCGDLRGVLEFRKAA